MAQILVRGLDDEVVRRLKARAKREGRSLQAEVRRILQQGAPPPEADLETARKLMKDLRRRLKGRQLTDSLELIREDRDR